MPQVTLTVNGKQHTVEIMGGITIKGGVKVDGNVVKICHQWVLLPKKVDFEIEGKKASLHRKSTFAAGFDLFLGNKKC